jgi:hypothetical protein
MEKFLQRFGGLVLGILCGLDRLVLRGKLRYLYSPGGMNKYLDVNGVLRKDFEAHSLGVTEKVLRASMIEQAKATDQFRYLNSPKIDKNALAREFAAKHRVREGLVCVLQCIEPCWSFDLESKASGEGKRTLSVAGKQRKCSHLYHYFIDPCFGWMYIRLQTWFPFEIQVYVNGREWLSRSMDREGLRYRRGDNKILRVDDWQRAQQLLDEQVRMDWLPLLDGWQHQVHPLHPGHLGKMPVQYNWTVFQSEWASDVVFASREKLQHWLSLWQRQALTYSSSEVLHFFGRAHRSCKRYPYRVETEWKQFYEGLRIKHWADNNSLKMYDYLNLVRVETTINDASHFKVQRPSDTDPAGPVDWREMRRSVAELPRRAEVCQQVNERYLEAMSAVKETRSVRELVEPICARVTEPGKKSERKLRALNPWSKEDAALLQTIGDPKWMVAGIRNRDLVAILYPEPASDDKEKRRRSARVTRLLRLLRAHGLLQKVPKTHRYQVSANARSTIVALLAAGNANPAKLTTKAA